VIDGIAQVLSENDIRIEKALRTLLAEPGSPHAGAAAALADLNDFAAVTAAADAALAEIDDF
jgi:hypothetical protein